MDDFEEDYPTLASWEQAAEDDPVEPIWGWLGAVGAVVGVALLVEWVLIRGVW